MITRILALALAGSTLAVSACYDDGYGYGYSVGWGTPYPYYGWYDGYYGSIYDGYWGGDGFFYYRNFSHDHHFHRADRDHFMHGPPPGGGHQFREHRGEFRPQQGMNMPQWRGGSPGGPGGGRPGGGSRGSGGSSGGGPGPSGSVRPHR